MRSKNLKESISYALDGFVFGIKFERNIKIQIVVSILALFIGIVLEFSLSDMLFILLWIGIVISAEFFNTAIERTLDSISEDFSPKIKLIKDLSASAVFILAILAVISGGLIFLKYINLP
ncbi:MAG TPA: diacylglycerol kinase family protein [Dictyoglomaceae bacterium]|nr:diacylglycerol kinase family protein [Dictyoglomaceae bacterium]HOL38924.1 diacylglycerol kinase family protein [Dictyoglomaceae bacterium]HOP94888.1 diacylglycerol kinase family protein [Dictyoglomaceae bacterium]HPP15659.1 diacylglycerol kinase family protein [Dictyoglomaceae bacterium]HPU43375.1 diacylglycerol kinase family protein [Dictyoglomaceae bacterium]